MKLGNFIDLTGMIFGRWTVLELESKTRGTRWLCECSCEKKTRKAVISSSLRSGESRSCGCLRREAKTKHGLCGTRVYNIYHGMIKRCYNKKEAAYIDYGGRGIKVCDEWLGEDGFINFNNWAIENGYSDDFSIDRQDNNGNYEPRNCSWATSLTQGNNKRNNNHVEIDHESKTMMEWSRIQGGNKRIVRDRIRLGWKSEDLLMPTIIQKAEKHSGVTGVIWDKVHSKWVTRISFNGKRINVGYFNTMEEAIEAKKEYLSSVGLP